MAVILWNGCEWILIWSALKVKAAFSTKSLVPVWQAAWHHMSRNTNNHFRNNNWRLMLLSSLECNFLIGTRSQRSVAHWMKPCIFCFQWCISCVFACCLINQNSQFCCRNKYLKYILHWHRWVLVQRNDSFFSADIAQTFIVVAGPLDTTHTYWFSIHNCSLHSYYLFVCFSSTRCH